MKKRQGSLYGIPEDIIQRYAKAYFPHLTEEDITKGIKSVQRGPIKGAKYVKTNKSPYYTRVNSDGTKQIVSDGSGGTYNFNKVQSPLVKKSGMEHAFHAAITNEVNPLEGYPDIIGAIRNGQNTGVRLLQGRANIQDYNGTQLEDPISTRVANAAWRKYNNMPYDSTVLSFQGPDIRGGWQQSYRLPRELEEEIPVDTILLKDRIDRNKKLKEEGEYNFWLNEALRSDEAALNALRKTYATGEPVGLQENAFNSRDWSWAKNWSNVPVGPLNVLANYNVRYDPKENRMYYSDTYGFDNSNPWYLGGANFDNVLHGTPFRIRGFIDLNKK